MAKRKNKLTEEQIEKLGVKFGKSLNPKSPQFIDMDLEGFKKVFSGKLPFDLDHAWQWIVKNR
jgi:hypothetical protein